MLQLGRVPLRQRRRRRAHFKLGEREGRKVGRVEVKRLRVDELCGTVVVIIIVVGAVVVGVALPLAPAP